MQLEKKSPPLKGSTLAATVFCLRPSAIRTNATVTWTTCPTTPKGQGEGCAEGTFGVTFRSRSWDRSQPRRRLVGRRERPGGGVFSLPGTGKYSCTATYRDRDSGLQAQSYKKSVAVRDQGVGFAAVGNRIKIGWSVHPGRARAARPERRREARAAEYLHRRHGHGVGLLRARSGPRKSSPPRRPGREDVVASSGNQLVLVPASARRGVSSRA